MKINKFFIITVIYLVVILIFSAMLSLGVRRLPDVGQSGRDKEVWIFSGHPVTQNFSPKRDGLNVVSIYLRNVMLRNQEPFRFTLSDASGNILRSINLTGYNIVDGQDIRFQFDPIVPSKDRVFTITLASDSPENIAIGAGFNSREQSLAFQTYYYPTNRIDALASASSSFMASLLRPRFLLTGLFFGLVGFFIIRLLAHRLRVSQDL